MALRVGRWPCSLLVEFLEARITPQNNIRHSLLGIDILWLLVPSSLRTMTTRNSNLLPLLTRRCISSCGVVVMLRLAYGQGLFS